MKRYIVLYILFKSHTATANHDARAHADAKAYLLRLKQPLPLLRKLAHQQVRFTAARAANHVTNYKGYRLQQKRLESHVTHESSALAAAAYTLQFT